MSLCDSPSWVNATVLIDNLLIHLYLTLKKLKLTPKMCLKLACHELTRGATFVTLDYTE